MANKRQNYVQGENIQNCNLDGFLNEQTTAIGDATKTCDDYTSCNIQADNESFDRLRLASDAVHRILSSSSTSTTTAVSSSSNTDTPVLHVSLTDKLPTTLDQLHTDVDNLSTASDNDTGADFSMIVNGPGVDSCNPSILSSEGSDSDISEMSDLSGLSEDAWRPIAGPISWVQRQMVMGRDPRDVLNGLIPADALIPDDIGEFTLWKLVIDLVSEPPRRKKLAQLNTLDDAIRLIRESRHIVVLTGAGVSVSCGIPDFRSKDGIYARLALDFPDLPDPQSMFDINYFTHDPRPFFKFAKEIYPGQFEPSRCHRFIRLIEKHGQLLRNYTQNIDTLEQVVGIEGVIQCHGSFATATCMNCQKKVDSEVIRDDIFNQVIPRCSTCSPPDNIMKPDIVFFGESLSDEFHNQMAEDKESCDLLIVIGSSLKVRPVALIPNSLPNSVPQILINRESLRHMTFDIELLGDCDVIVSELCERLAGDWSILSNGGQCMVEVSKADLEQRSVDRSGCRVDDDRVTVDEASMERLGRGGDDNDAMSGSSQKGDAGDSGMVDSRSIYGEKKGNEVENEASRSQVADEFSDGIGIIGSDSTIGKDRSTDENCDACELGDDMEINEGVSGRDIASNLSDMNVTSTLDRCVINVQAERSAFRSGDNGKGLIRSSQNIQEDSVSTSKSRNERAPVASEMRDCSDTVSHKKVVPSVAVVGITEPRLSHGTADTSCDRNGAIGDDAHLLTSGTSEPVRSTNDAVLNKNSLDAEDSAHAGSCGLDGACVLLNDGAISSSSCPRLVERDGVSFSGDHSAVSDESAEGHPAGVRDVQSENIVSTSGDAASRLPALCLPRPRVDSSEKPHPPDSLHSTYSVHRRKRKASGKNHHAAHCSKLSRSARGSDTHSRITTDGEKLGVTTTGEQADEDDESSITDFITDTEYLFLPPSRYVFSGAEFSMEDDRPLTPSDDSKPPSLHPGSESENTESSSKCDDFDAPNTDVRMETDEGKSRAVTKPAADTI